MQTTDYEKIIRHLKNQLDFALQENAEMKARLNKLVDSTVESTKPSKAGNEREAITVIYNPDTAAYEKLIVSYDLNSGNASVRSEKLSKQHHIAAFQGNQLLEKQLLTKGKK